MSYLVINNTYLRKVYRRRENWVHKGNFGKIMVIGGNSQYTGSPAMVALAALRTGADITKIVAPRRAADVCASFSPELITIPLNKDSITYDDIDTIRQALGWPNVVAIGNGLGDGEEQRQVVNTIIKEFKKKFVIDADGVKVVNRDFLDNNVLITPNTHEFELLFETKLSNNIEDRIFWVKEKARQYSTNILLKGHVDVISDGEYTFINKTNTTYMTKAGTGDVLAGICAGLIGQGNKIIDSACAGAFINGYTGRYIARTKREALSPMDIINGLYYTTTKWRYH